MFKKFITLCLSLIILRVSILS